MKIVSDENLSFKLCRQLNDLFPGSRQVRLLGLDGADDRAIWDYARANGFVLVTLDADFIASVIADFERDEYDCLEVSRRMPGAPAYAAPVRSEHPAASAARLT